MTDIQESGPELTIRKWHTIIEEVHTTEIGRLADDTPLVKLVIAATILNPYAGQFATDLSAAVRASHALGQAFASRLIEAAGKRGIMSYGKACIVGERGEYEHGNAFLTNTFAEPIRAAIGGGKSWIPSTGKRGGLGTIIDVPLAHKDALYVRACYDTVTASFGDAPNSDEIVVILAAATRGRLKARLGGLQHGDIKGEDGLV